MKKFFRRIGHSINNTIVEPTAKTAGKGINKVVNNDNIEGAAGILNDGLNKAKEVAKKVKDADYAGMAGKVNKAIMTDNDSYKKIGKNIGVSPKVLIADAVQSEIKEAGDMAAAAFNAISNEKNPARLIKKVSSEDSLIGWKLTGFGKTAIISGAAVAGLPGAGREMFEGRRGYNASQQPETSAPRLPAYADNAGATGDLVFALNNLRHGGMM